MIQTTRTKWIATAMSLAILLVLPLPDFSAAPARIVAVLLLWAGNLFFSYCCFFRPQWTFAGWVVFLVTAAFQFLVLKNPVTLVLAVIWRFWLSARQKRIQLESLKKAAVFILVLGAGAWGPGAAAQIPKVMQGYKVEGLASCGLVDQIPWTFRKGKRQSRFLMRDKMRLSTQSDFSIWEVHQVLDPGGYMAYVFKRIRDDGIGESIVTKEQHYNRILEKGKDRRIAEVRSLKTLIDRPVLSFYTPQGASVVFRPSLGGLAKLQINFSGVTNRIVPPMELVGRSCERLEDAPDPAAPATAAAAGAAGAAGASGAAAGAGGATGGGAAP
jgi:hypothetical protein